MVAGTLIALASYLPAFGAIDFGVRLAVTAFGAALIWVPAMLLTPPEAEATLERFYRHTRPGGPGWRRQRLTSGLAPLQDLGSDLRAAGLGIVVLFALMFGVGWLILGPWPRAALALLIALLGVGLLRRVRRWSPVTA